MVGIIRKSLSLDLIHKLLIVSFVEQKRLELILSISVQMEEPDLHSFYGTAKLEGQFTIILKRCIIHFC